MYKSKILIVDDKAENILALSELVSAADVEIISATSGDTALEMLLKHEFSLALLDVQMPLMSGIELGRLMRSAERSKGVPIIFVTASQGNQTAIFEGYDSGAVDYLQKPLDVLAVRSKVRVFVELDQNKHALKEKSDTLALKLREVESLREEADAANRAKSRFLANMSHEMRTPLGAVLGFSEILKLPDQTAEDRQNCIAAIERNGRVLLKLIDDILDLSKVEANHLETERVKVSLIELIDDIRSVHGLKAGEKGIAFEIAAEGRLPHFVVTDGLRLKQVLNNIVGNAVKFTAAGHVTVSLALQQDSFKETSMLRVLVTDTGVGLTSTEAQRLFQPFMQADSSTKRKFGGTGLGLAISRSFARLLGGDVVLLKSEKDRGSTFEISVDVGKIDAEALVDATELLEPGQVPVSEVSPDRTALAGISILVVDDARDNRALMKRMLEHAGAEVQLASDGEEAVDKATTQDFNIILMDIQMPKMDGYEATSKLRRLGYNKPILALTAHAMRAELERCLEAGCDQCLSKPVARKKLIEVVKESLGKTFKPVESLRLAKTPSAVPS